MLFVLDRILKLTHPFMPFITEEIWQSLPKSGNEVKAGLSIMTQPYPEMEDRWLNRAAEKKMDLIQKIISAIRNIRGEMNVPQERKAKVIIRGPNEKLKLIKTYEKYMKKLATVESLELGERIEKPRSAATYLVEDLEIFVPLGDLIDLRTERGRIEKEMSRLKQALDVLSLKLNNQKFIKKAPPEIVEKEKQKEADFLDKIRKLEKNLEVL
jgi:valyl-tRNA synthetase